MGLYIRANPADIARYAFVPGAHDRARKIAAQLNDARLVSDSNGYLVFTGTVDGIPMTVASTGMGGPTVAICMEELGHMGVDTFIRVGSCGTFQDHVDCGDVIVSSGTFRAGGTANNYLPLGFPAVPDFDVTTALVEAAQSLDLKVHVGLGTAGDAFYGARDPNGRIVMKQAGVVSAEMESDTLYVLAAVRRWRSGALYASDGTSTETKPEWGEAAFRQGEDNAIRIAIEAMKQIALKDNAAGT